VLNVDPANNAAYYRTTVTGEPGVIPEPAISLANLLGKLTTTPAASSLPEQGPPEQSLPTPVPQDDLEITRQAAVRAVDRLYARLDARWTAYFGLPASFGDARRPADVAALKAALKRFDTIADDPQYQALWQQPEFKATHHFLQEYVSLLEAASSPKLSLPPPPSATPEAETPRR
jgi:hypothetical protein